MDEPYSKSQRLGHIALTLLTLGAFVLCVLTLTAGSTPALRQAKIMTIDMTGRGTPIWAKRSFVNNEDPATLPCQPSDASTKAVPSLPNKIAPFRPTQTGPQLRPEFYYIYLWAWCGGVYEQNLDVTNMEIKSCSAWTPTMDYSIVDTVISVIPPDIDIDPDLESNSLAGTLYVTYAMATSLTGVAFAVEALTVFKMWSFTHNVLLFVYSLAFSALIVGSSGATWLTSTLVHKIDEAGIHAKTSANIGGVWLAFTWTTVVFLLLRVLFLIFSQMRMFRGSEDAASSDKNNSNSSASEAPPVPPANTAGLGGGPAMFQFYPVPQQQH